MHRPEPHQISTDCYQELRQLARCCLGKKRSTDTLGTTALVNETYARLAGTSLIDGDLKALKRYAAQVMRSVIVDYARSRNAQKRSPSGQRIPLDDLIDELQSHSTDMVILDDALCALAKIDEKLVRIVELRFFARLTVEETAQVLGISCSSVKREWRLAKMWLKTKLGADDGCSYSELGSDSQIGGVCSAASA